MPLIDRQLIWNIWWNMEFTKDRFWRWSNHTRLH